ncbi:hypothetical protein HA466_0161210 [Hirschfeldia incana]|nr:hypothetical protein HA466_0161210 [Hirschfeldia incana]
MNSRGKYSSARADQKVTKEPASVIPIERKLVKAMVLKTIISAFTPSGSDRGSESTGDGNGNHNGGRVHPSR